MIQRLFSPLLALCVVLFLPFAARAQESVLAPAGHGMVAAADPRAVAAGAAMLEKGGSATDAAIAAMAVLGLVEPQSAGIGGGGFLVGFDASRGEVSVYDGRETAPATATPGLFLGPDGKPMGRLAAIRSGKSVGAPGLVAMLKLAHDRHGKLAWRELFEPAIALAEQGFEVSPRLNGLIARMGAFGGFGSAEARAYLLDAEGKPRAVGTRIFNPEYAATLRAIARQGPRALSRGPIAAAIVAAAQAGPDGGGLTLEDLKAYEPKRVTPVCAPYRVYRVCGAPPPSSGGVAIAMILGLYERARPQPQGVDSVDDWAAFLWASRLGYADRDYYVADEAFSPVPVYGLIAGDYLDARAALIDLARAPSGAIAPGDPAAVLGGESLIERWGGGPATPEAGTTHLSVVDSQGNAVSLTASIEAPFGAQRMAGGFFLNNQLTDFSFAPEIGGKPVANAVEPGKRPRSSMSPTIVLDAENRPVLIVGSPGGNAIIGYVAKTTIAALEWGLDVQSAAALANAVARESPAGVDLALLPPGVREGLEARGWALRDSSGEASGVHVIRVGPEGLQGGADPRREGEARAVAPPARRR